MSEDRRSALEVFLARATGAHWVRVLGEERLGGGAIQDNRLLLVEFAGGRLDGRHELVLRTDAPSGVAASWDREHEFRILEAVHAAGVAAPEPVALCTDPAVLGRPFFLMRRVRGEARGVRLVRDPDVIRRGPAIVREVAREMAKLHGIRPPHLGLDFLPLPRPDPARARIALYREWLDALGAAEPVIEHALRRLELEPPRRQETVLVHADLRTGNIMVADGALTAILDWEFAAWSDPYEDLAWFCARYWRFGADEREAGGLAPRAVLAEAYEEASGRRVDPKALAFWEVMANLRWAVIALQQAERHRSGVERSLELALTGAVLPRLERDILDSLRGWERT